MPAGEVADTNGSSTCNLTCTTLTRLFQRVAWVLARPALSVWVPDRVASFTRKSRLTPPISFALDVSKSNLYIMYLFLSRNGNLYSHPFRLKPMTFLVRCPELGLYLCNVYCWHLYMYCLLFTNCLSDFLLLLSQTYDFIQLNCSW